MEDIPATIALAAAAFASTNVDDVVLLSLYFSNRSYSAASVFAGQYLGIGVLVAASLALALAAELISTGWVHWLGLLPIAIGLIWLRDFLHSKSKEPTTLDETNPPASMPALLAVLSVAVVTVTNGGDNLGVYAPLFAAGDTSEVAVDVAAFAVLTGVWCCAGYALTRNRLFEARIASIGRTVAPFVLIAVGLSILLEV